MATRARPALPSRLPCSAAAWWSGLGLIADLGGAVHRRPGHSGGAVPGAGAAAAAWRKTPASASPPAKPVIAPFSIMRSKAFSAPRRKAIIWRSTRRWPTSTAIPRPEALISGLTDIGAQLYVDPRRRDEFRALMQANDVVTDFVSEIYHRSGRRIWISENARAVRDWSGALLCYEGTVEDVTEKFEQERALRAALRQAEIANRMKAAFLAAMSHELKTPLNAVLGFSEIIRDEVAGPGRPCRPIAIMPATFMPAARGCLSVINDVLDVSRLEGGLADHRCRGPRTCWTSPNRPSRWRGPSPATARHRDRCAGRYAARCMSIRAAWPRRWAICWPMPSNSRPKAARSRFAARLQPDGGVHLVVEDTGIGMAQETIAAALEPFRQLDGSLARDFEGAGLGLSIAKALAELHGGSLQSQERGGRGHHRHHRLPAARAAVARDCAKVA